MYDGMGDMGFSLEDLADEEQAQQGQVPANNDAANQVSAAPFTPTAQQQPVPNQVPVYTQQWQQWDQQRRAGNIQPLPPTPTPMPQAFPWKKVLVGAGIAAAVVAGVVMLRKKSKKQSRNKPSNSGSWQTIGGDE